MLYHSLPINYEFALLLKLKRSNRVHSQWKYNVTCRFYLVFFLNSSLVCFRLIFTIIGKMTNLVREDYSGAQFSP